MILNHTRFSSANLCWRKTFNQFHRRLAGSHSISRTDGVAYHAGVAHALAKNDWSGGLAVARAAFDAEIAAAGDLLPFEQYAVQDNWEVTELMYKLYQENYDGMEMQMLQPECEFNVPLTTRHHFCIWKHWRHRSTGEEFWTPPPPEAILGGQVESPHHIDGNFNTNCACFDVHRIIGKIDGLWLWKHALWINDHKTTALAPDSFWPQWSLNYQPSIYMYGAQKALGILPKGFIINAIFKPSEAQVTSWNNKRKHGPPQSAKDYLKYGREAFLRSTEDIERARREFAQKADEWEWRIVNGAFPLSPPPGPACRMYNKTCEFHQLCTNHDSEKELQNYAIKTDYDYVEKALFNITDAEEA